MRRSHVAAVAVVVAMVLVTVGSADSAEPRGARTFVAIKTVSSSEPFDVPTEGFQDLPGSAIRIPTGNNGLIVATLSATTRCYNSVSRCAVRILVDDVEMNPAVGTVGTFDSARDDKASARSITRSIGGLRRGRHIVKVQMAPIGAPTRFKVDDWHLVVQSYR